MFPITPTKVTSNLPRLAQQLRGGRQPRQDLINQLQGLGAHKADLDAYALNLPTKLSPLEAVAQLKVPQLYVQPGAALGDSEEAFLDAATDIALENMMSGEWSDLRAEAIIGQIRDPVKRAEALAAHANDPNNGLMHLLGDEVYENLLNQSDLIDAFIESEMDGVQDFGKHTLGYYNDVQRQPSSHNRDYRELVFRVGSKRAKELGLPRQDSEPLYHFDNPGYLGHLRSSYDPRSKRYIVEELQSDLDELIGTGKLHLPRPPELTAIYPKLAAAGLEDAIKQGAELFTIPPLEMIAKARGINRGRPSYQLLNRIYGGSLDRGFFKRILERAGAEGPSPRELQITDEVRRLYEDDPTFLGFKQGGRL